LIRIALFVLCCLLSARASAEPASDPLSGRLMSDTDTLCFSRIYPASHLARHPGQATAGVVLSFRRDAIRIMLRQKRVGQPSYVVATCEWSADASVDYEGKPMFPGFKQGAAFACIVMITPQSAEEGGTALIDPAPDARSLTLYLDSPVSAQRGLDRDDDLFDLKLGRQDRVFKLTRTHPDACKAMDKVLKHP
jgi:hypothetical protein